MDIGERIRKKRLAQGLTLEQVAFAADMDASNLSRIERGMQQPSSTLLKRIATALHIPVSQLYGEAEDGSGRQVRQEPPGYGQDTRKLLQQFQQLDTHHRKLAVEFIKLLTRTQNQAEEKT